MRLSHLTPAALGCAEKDHHPFDTGGDAASTAFRLASSVIQYRESAYSNAKDCLREQASAAFPARVENRKFDSSGPIV